MIDAVYEWRSSCRGGSSWAFRLCVLIAAHLRRPLHSRCFREMLTFNVQAAPTDRGKWSVLLDFAYLYLSLKTKVFAIDRYV
jgi:hypothetical protein